MEPTLESAPKKRRIPKACAACRTSKLKCDGGKPCTRCIKAEIWCDYVKGVDDPVREKLAQLEEQVQALRTNATANLQPQTQPEPLSATGFIPVPGIEQFQEMNSPMSIGSGTQGTVSHIENIQQFQENPQISTIGSLKRKRRDFEINVEVAIDVVRKGLISYEDGRRYFAAFFQGCDKYVPVFDNGYDTFESVKERSALLFDIICVVGCRAEHGPGSQQYQILSNASKTPLCDVILGVIPKSVETIQALLVNACYSEKGWMLTSMAVKMALDLDLPDSYARLSSLMLRPGDRGQEGERRLLRETRVWFGTFVLEHILSLDCGKKPSVKSADGMRRCRVLLGHPDHTALDFRLLAQVELNSIRALAHERLSPGSGTALSDDEMSEIVQETRIDLSVWLNDWVNLVETSICNEEDIASLVVNFKIQRDWSEMTMLCKGLQEMGIENVAIMSDSQRDLIHLAKSSAQRHLSIIISNPDLYLATFRYGMDFVWAKCAFSVLLLLKLARVVPSSTNMSSLVSDAKTLLSHLSRIRGSSNIYFRILCLSVEKCEKALNEDSNQLNEGTGAAAELDFQSYVPQEFILEWNFPGLNFCWIPFDFQDLFIDFGNGF